MVDYLQVGVITSTHGVHGEVKVYPLTDDMHRFSDLAGEEVVVEGNGTKTSLRIEQARYFKDRVILKFKGIDDMDTAQQYCRREIWIPRSLAIPLEEGEYFVGDLIGMRAIDESGRELGRIRDILQTGANDVYVIERSGMKDLLVPAIRDCILQVDTTQGFMRIHLLKGLEDL